MRKWLAASVALAPLVMAHSAFAETVLTGLKTAPVATATANGGAPDDVRVDAQGSLQIKGPTALTLNSNNSVTNQGNITMATADSGATAILVVGGHTGTVTNSGVILLDDGLTSSDTNADGIVDGPFANGTGRYGIRQMTGVLTGDIVNSGSITVHGNASYAISIEGGLDGKLTSTGPLTVIGDNTFGVRTQGTITGNVSLSSVSASGSAATAVSLEGDVGGKVLFNGSIISTGYRSTTHLTLASGVQAKLTPDELLQGGPAVVIAGNVGHGVVVDAAPTADATHPDVDGDGTPDTGQTTGGITQYGSSAALLIGSSAHAINIGQVGTTVAASAPDYAYGLIVKGSISSNGVYLGRSALGVDIGAGGQGVNISGGMRVAGTISTLAYQANATALLLESGAHLDAMVVSGSIAAASRTNTTSQSAAVIIDNGAFVGTLTNSGSITSAVAGAHGNAYAIADLSGSLSTINNTGNIIAAVAVDATDPETAPSDEVTGTATAIDVSANTTGFQYHQSQSAVTGAAAPVLSGIVRLGSGADVMDIQAGTVTGSLFFGAGADTLTIGGGAKVTGFISDSDHALAVNVNSGLLEVRNITGDFTVPTAPVYTVNTLGVTSLHVGATGQLNVVLDPTHPATEVINSSGAVTFDSGSKLGIRFASLLPTSAFTTPLSFTVVQTTPGQLSGTPVLDTASTSVPYLYQATETTDLVHGRVLVNVNRRSAADAGMIAVEASAYNAVYQALNTDAALRNAFLAQTDRSSFFHLYSQLLPDHSGAPLLSLASGVDATSRALMDRRPVAEPGETTGWLQEINFYADKKQDNAYGFRTNGFGMASGVERGTSLGSIGLSLAFTSSDMKDPSSENDENLTAKLVEFGLYWRATGQKWRTWARVAGGYAMFDSTREFFASTAAVDRKATSNWTGTSISAGAGASYEISMGRFFLRPEASIEYFGLNERARTESGGQYNCFATGATTTSNCGDAFDLIIGSRTGHMTTGKLMLSLGGKFGDQGWLQPEIRVGYRQNFGTDPGVTLAQFKSGGSPFSLVADSLDGGGPVLGFRILAQGGMGYLALEGDAELMDLYSRYSLMLRAGYRF